MLRMPFLRLASCALVCFFTAFVSPSSRASHPPSPAGPSPLGPSTLGERINRAIEAGREALAPRLKPLIEDPRSDYPIGRIALVLTALLQAGVPTDAPLVAGAFNKLATMKPVKTYGASVYLFALNALLDRLVRDRHAASSADRVETRQGARKGDAWPPSEVEIHRRIAGLVSWLVKARTQRRGSWTYETGTDTRKHDFSNTQFAVLGLHVGMEHGITIPAEIFADIIRLFSTSVQLEKSRVTLTYQPTASLEASLGLAPRQKRRRTRVRPGGWAYRAPSSRGARKTAYAAMTAAGASSVTIAVKALRRSKEKKWQRLIRSGEKTLHQSYAWIEKHFDQFIDDGRGLFYTLYSLEKVGDLGGVASFGGRNWYLEGCRRLVEKQRENGSWGSYVDTSLALLFLTRATRSLTATAAPVLLTRGREGMNDSANDTDLVYVKSAKGFLSAGELLRYMAVTRNSRLIAVGREIVRNYDFRHKADLVPFLLELWQRGGRLTKFARDALKEITGESFRTKLDCRDWYRAYRDIKSLDNSPALEAVEVAKRLRAHHSPVLKAELVRLAHRRKMRSLRGLLVDELLTAEESSYRRLLHGILSLWTGSGIVAPADDDHGAWTRTAKEWRRWCREHPPNNDE